MRKLWSGLFLILLGQAAMAQGTTVTGRVMDTLEKKPLHLAVISLVQKSDSTLYRFTRSDREGKFRFTDVAPGPYLLLLTYPKFADFGDEVTIREGVHDLGAIPLTQKARLLDAVVIRSAGAIRIKGDTTEYVADSFAVSEGATVEELLKKLPGFQVNSRGEITAQGQRVQKVLVDGEEFFGDDPTMATKNISARAVDKVQVFDNKTDQQQLTGISSGNEGKTVNIKLKEDKKKGSFGRLEAGSDFRDLVDAKALYNRFIGKRKLSLYGTKSSTSTGSLNWEERNRLGFENDFEYDELSGYYFSFGGDDEFSNWSLRGLPDAYTAGGLFINRWDNDRHGINASYRFNRLGTVNQGSTVTQNILPGSISNTIYRTTNRGLNQQHALNGKYEWKLDSLTSFKLTLAGLRKTTEALNRTATEFYNGNNELATTSARTNDLLSTRMQSDNQLQYRQAFKKKNRLLIGTLRFGVTEDEQDGMLNALTTFYRPAGDSIDLLDQRKLNTGQSTTLGAKLTFSEPLSDKWNLVMEYSHNRNNSISHRNTFENSGNGKYDIRNPVFSNNFDLDAASNTGSLIARYNTRKVRFAFGSGLSSVGLDLLNLDNQERNDYHFLNLTPQSSFNYQIKPQTNIGLNYRGTTRQPTINQLQPIRDNSDPLNVFLGNEDLRVGFNHNISLFYNSYKVLSGRGIWINGSYNFTKNAIANYSTIDPFGKKTYMPVNVNGNRGWWFWSEWNKGEGEKKFNYTARFQTQGGRNISFVNGRENQTDFGSYTVAPGLRYEFPEKYSFYLSPEVSYNSSRSSLNPDATTNYFSSGGRIESFLMLPGKLELRSNAQIDLRERINAFDTNPNVILWDAYLSRKVFKDKSGKIILQARDLLDQNKGFNRMINSNFITEERFQRLSRYFLLQFEWTFNKMPGQTN